MGDLAVDHVRRYLEEHKDALADGALRVAFAMADPRFVPVATRLAQNPNAEVRARAVALLGAVGAADEVAPVTAHLTDPEPAVRAAAARALGRMGHWPRAPALASLMRDTSWDVRRAAGLALRDLGSPGLIMLRKMSTDANQFAADMARQVLDLPETAVGATA
jgi:HEAT repeat protein